MEPFFLPDPENATSAGAILQGDLIDPPDLTNTLRWDMEEHARRGYFAIVYKCLCTQNDVVVAVKVFTLSSSFDRTEEDSIQRKMRRELAIWKRLDHPNVVPLLGIARLKPPSSYPSMVATWMPNGTLFEYVNQRAELPLQSRVQLIKGIAAGLKYLHSNSLVHGDMHPKNIMIDQNHNARLTDFGLSQALNPGQDLSYLLSVNVAPGARLWAAPELLFPHLYPGFKIEATPKSDIYSLGCIILFAISGVSPWPSVKEMEPELSNFRHPPRPEPPAILDNTWKLIRRCWSLRNPGSRPSAQGVLQFFEGIGSEAIPSTSDANVVLLGLHGCGKNSIINLLTEDRIAQVSANRMPCTKPRCYRISIGERRFRLWDTLDFPPANGEDTDSVSPYEQAHTLLRNLTNGVNLILLCVHKDKIFASLGNLYRLISDVFYGGRAPIALVVTHCDKPDERWWGRNVGSIAQSTGMPVQSIPHACITTIHPGYHRSKRSLRELLESHANGQITLFRDLTPDASSLLSILRGMNTSLAKTLVKQFRKPPRPANVVFFGKVGAGKSSVVNLIAGNPIANVDSGGNACTLEYRCHSIGVARIPQFQAWDTVGFGSTSRWDNIIGSRATKDASKLARQLSKNGGIDLLVFVKECGPLCESERDCYRFFCEKLCEGKIPVAIVITHLESYEPMEIWWDKNGDRLVTGLGGNVIGHACVTSHAIGEEDSWYKQQLEESTLSVQAMLKDCLSLCPLV